MFILPVSEDSWLFRACLYYGLLVLLVELLVPLIFHRRVRIEIPRFVLPAPAVPLPPRVFQQRRRKLQQQAAALQRALAETPRLSPQEKRQLLTRSATKRRRPVVTSPSPSFVVSSGLDTLGPLVELTRPTSPRQFNGNRWTVEPSAGSEGTDTSRLWRTNEESRSSRSPSPMAMSHFFRATRAARQGGFSFHEATEEEKDGTEMTTSVRKEPIDRMQVVDRRMAKRKESAVVSRQRPVRFVSEGAEHIGYAGSSGAGAQLEALTRARWRQQVTTRRPERVLLPPSDGIALSASAEKLAERSVLGIPDPTARGTSPYLARQLHKGKVMNDDVTRKKSGHIGALSTVGRQSEKLATESAMKRKEIAQDEPLTAFQAFCASFAAGGSAAARQAAAKRKHREAFEAEDKHAHDTSATGQQIDNHAKRPRTFVQASERSNGGGDVAVTSHSVGERVNDEKQVVDATATTQGVLEKRKYDQAFGTTEGQDRLHEK
ncbi:unnamed protein product [Hyaloperonospora brassicae]|uniref:RxLR effector candidate protein n=1 Tax=Hyaloperonospora brassicae TaxID=162125 RepID=A0AAV0UY19_HYABA|nr:unnamed protein product [Hyaloperonospora brassicae]